MTSVDQRTRFENDAVDLDPSSFLADVAPELIDGHGPAAGRSAATLVPLTLDVEGEPITLVVRDGALSIERRAGDDLVVALDRAAFSDLVQDVNSTFGLTMLGRAQVRQGKLDAFIEWEPALRTLLDGRPVYTPGSIDFTDHDGAPLDLRRSFAIDDDPAEMGHFLSQAGYLHVRGMFTEAEMAEVSNDLDMAMAAATQGDGASWWARTGDGWYPARILGFNHHSAALRELVRSDRFAMLGRLTDDEFVMRDPDASDSAEGLFKKIGVVEGPSDVSWHKDCSLGGHSRGCCGLTVGISVTGAGPTNGELGAMAGSHRANVVPLGIDGLDLPRIPLPTTTGDLTVHCSCTLHMSRPPVSAERRVVYTGFGLAPRPGDRSDTRTPEEIRRARAALTDRVTERQNQPGRSTRAANFDLPDGD